MCNSLRLVLALCTATLAAIPLAAEQLNNEQLLFVSPPKWTEVFNDREDNLSTTEYVPETQTADAWQEMLSVQIVLGMKNANPEKVLANVAIHLAEECFEFDAKPIELGGAGDYPTLGMMMLCGTHIATKRGEFSLLRGIAGKENFYLLRKTWRTEAYVMAEDPPIDLKDRKFWLSYLAYMRVCDTAGGTCPQRLEEKE